jgi:hypothetical protein
MYRHAYQSLTHNVIESTGLCQQKAIQIDNVES